MEPKLISLIEKEMPTWRTDFDVAEWKRSCDLYTTAYGWLSNEKLYILKIEKREQYRQLFLEFARKHLGFCTYRRDGPTDNFGESDSWGYEKILFELEEFKCNNNRYSECPFNLKNTIFTALAPEYWLFILGGLFVLVTLFIPNGIVGLVKDQLDKKKIK